MKKVIQILFIVSFLSIIFGVGTISFIKSDREKSDFENRTLAQPPTITQKALLTGEFSKEFETYFADQLFARDEIIEAYTQGHLMLSKGIINNVVVAANNWLFNLPYDEKIYGEMDPSLVKLKAFSDAVRESNVEIYFAAVPNKMNMLKDLYPPFINKNSGVGNLSYFMKNLPESIKGYSLYEEFKKSYTQQQLEEMYFKTDHHWNIEGAFTGYQKIIQLLSEESPLFDGEPIQKEELNLVCNNEAFFVGSHNRQLYNMISTKTEKVCYYEPFFDKENGTVIATPLWGGQDMTDINQFYATGIDKEEIYYSDLFTGDLPEIKFEYKNTGNELHLLVLKDSYANPIQPFIAQHFNKTSILDIRHYKEKSVSQYIKDHNVDIVVFIYNDTNITDKAEMYENLID